MIIARRVLGLLLLMVLVVAGAVLYGPGKLVDLAHGERFTRYELLRSERTFPWDRIGEPVVMVLAGDSRQLRTAWSSFGLSGTVPELEWDRSVVLVLGTGEAGTCPLTLEGVSVNAAAHMLTVHVRIRGSKYRRQLVCTADWIPRTFAVVLPRRNLPPGALSGRVEEHAFLLGSKTSIITVLRQPDHP